MCRWVPSPTLPSLVLPGTHPVATTFYLVSLGNLGSKQVSCASISSSVFLLHNSVETWAWVDFLPSWKWLLTFVSRAGGSPACLPVVDSFCLRSKKGQQGAGFLTPSLQQMAFLWIWVGSRAQAVFVHVFHWQLITIFFVRGDPMMCSSASLGIPASSSSLTKPGTSCHGGWPLGFLSLPPVLLLMTQWKPMEKSWRGGADCPCVEAPRDSALLVHTWPLMIHYSFCCLLTCFYDYHHQQRNSPSVLYVL